jgi:hypothetical protein
VKKTLGYEIYNGPSMIDGRPVVAIVTPGSANVKTGSMAQVWILPADENPSRAIHTGSDASVCGDCKHRGSIVDGRNTGRTCYVLVFQAPRSVWEAWKRGRYTVSTPAAAAVALAGQNVRLGAYGDPAALPADVSRAIVSMAPKHTGYTHQWQGSGSGPELADVCMASADTPAEASAAAGSGFRYFRVSAVGVNELTAGEISCPASAESGKVTTCDRCGLCSGSVRQNDGRKHIVIQAHGAGASRV